MFSLGERLHFLTLAGSHAHGTAREGSDLDLRGVCAAPLTVRLSLFESFEQYEGPLPEALASMVTHRVASHPSASRYPAAKSECVVFDIAKFVRLCVDANPNALEILFADERDHVCISSAFRRLRDERHRFLSVEVRQTFLGYALSQLKRIRTHRAWLLDPPLSKPRREDFGLPAAGAGLSADDRDRIEQNIARKIHEYGIDDLDLPKGVRLALRERVGAGLRDALCVTEDALEERLRAVATHALDLPANVIANLNAERRYQAAMKHWHAYEGWKSQRNPARAELERRFGYDTKHAMHLVRLMRMGLEALLHADLTVRRADAAELSAIRDGELSFDRLLELAKDLELAVRRAAERTTLPAAVDRAWADDVARSLMLDDARS